MFENVNQNHTLITKYVYVFIKSNPNSCTKKSDNPVDYYFSLSKKEQFYHIMFFVF